MVMGEDDLAQLQSDIQDSLEDIGYVGVTDLTEEEFDIFFHHMLEMTGMTGPDSPTQHQ